MWCSVFWDVIIWMVIIVFVIGKCYLKNKFFCDGGCKMFKNDVVVIVVIGCE